MVIAAQAHPCAFVGNFPPPTPLTLLAEIALGGGGVGFGRGVPFVVVGCPPGVVWFWACFYPYYVVYLNKGDDDMNYVLVKYRLGNGGRFGWYQMDIADARALFRSLSTMKKNWLMWFCVVNSYDVHYYHSSYGWSRGVGLLKYL